MSEVPIKVTVKWVCNKCNAVHDTQDDARECCAPKVCKVYVCPGCHMLHDSPDDALSCCGDALPSLPTADELEASGQMRIVP